MHRKWSECGLGILLHFLQFWSYCDGTVCIQKRKKGQTTIYCNWLFEHLFCFCFRWKIIFILLMHSFAKNVDAKHTRAKFKILFTTFWFLKPQKKSIKCEKSLFKLEKYWQSSNLRANFVNFSREHVEVRECICMLYCMPTKTQIRYISKHTNVLQF